MSQARQEIVARLRGFLTARHQLGDETAFGESTGLLGQGIGLDSVEALQLVATMEEVFGLTIVDEDLDAAHFQTVGTFTRFIEERLPSATRTSP
jgi:acyl carrier protein